MARSISRSFAASHRVRPEVGLEHVPLGVVDALGLLEEARHEVREEGLEVDGRHVEHTRRDLLPQLAGQVVFNNVALVRAKGASRVHFLKKKVC